ncbi:MAG: EamA family transporter [Rhizobiales bacterium]|nr:EamA family transporter [Hyphomicrobiales bacterium]
MFWLARNASATNTSLLACFMPVAAVVLGVAILGERLSWNAMGGFGLILLGAAIVTGNLNFWSRHQD